MEIIKEDYWNSYLVKHKEFQDLVEKIRVKAGLMFVAPVCETVVLACDVFLVTGRVLQGVKEDADLELWKVRDLDGYKTRLGYKQMELGEFKGFDWIRRLLFESNSEIVKEFDPTGSGELQVKPGQRFSIYSGDFHQNWCKGISENGQKGFIPKSCVQVFPNAQVLEESSNIYKFHPISEQDLNFLYSEHLKKLQNFVKNYKMLPGNLKDQRHLLALMSNILELSAAAELFLRNPEKLANFLNFLPLYVDSNTLCLKIFQYSADKTQLAQFTSEIFNELKLSVFGLRNYCYSVFVLDQSTWNSDILHVLSLACWSMSKPIQTFPTDKEILSLLEDPRQKSLKRLTIHQTSLILLPDFIIFASVPVKVKKILPTASILALDTLSDLLILKTSRKSYKFQMDSAKRAQDWSSEIKSMLTKRTPACWTCKEANLVKVVSSCPKCGKMVCWLCECIH